MARGRHPLFVLAAALGGAVLFTYAIRNVGWANVLGGISRVGWGLVPILALAGLRFLLRAGQDLRRFSAQTLHLLARQPRVVKRLADGIFPRLKYPLQRLPCELVERPQQQQKGDDGPDVKPQIGLDQWIHSGLRLLRSPCLRRLERDEQRNNFRDDGNAFEQQERQHDGTGDLGRGAGLTADGLCCTSGQTADSEPGANGGQTGAKCGARVSNRKGGAFHSLISFDP